MQTNKKNNSSTNLPLTYHLIILFFISAFTFLLYSNSYKAPFVFDDFDNFVNRTTMQMTVISSTSLKRAAFGGINKNRVIPNLTLGLNYFFNRHDVWGYHLINITVHTLTALMVYLLFFKTLGLSDNYNKKLSAEIALLATILWVANPIQTNVATYIVQRMTSFAALFTISSLVCYICARTTWAQRKSKWLLYLFSLTLFFLALLSKENSIILPVILLAYEYYFLGKSKLSLNPKNLAIIVIAGTTFLYIIGTIYVGTGFLGKILAGYAGRPFSLSERLLTEARVIFHYLSLIIFPLPSRLNLAYDFQVSHSIITPPQTLLACIGILALIYSVVYFFKRHKLLSFALFWFLINLIVESTIIPLELIFEHRLYLPSMFLALAAVLLVYSVTANHRQRGRSIIIMAILLMSIFTWQRNNVWSNEITFWEDAVNKSPFLARSYEHLSLAYDHAGKYKNIYKLLTAAKRRGLDTYNINNNLGKAAANLGKNSEAITYFEQAISIDGRQAESHYNLGVAYGNEGYKNKARREMLIGMRLMEQVQR